MPRRMETDRWLFLVTVALCLLGAVMVFSASAVTAREQYSNGYHFLLRQLLWLALGLAGMFAMMQTDYRRLRDPKFVFAFLGVVLLIAGFIRVMLGWHLKAGQHGGLVIFSGIVTALLGLIILIQWPFSSLFALGIILGIDLIQAGMSWINLGFFLKRRAH